MGHNFVKKLKSIFIIHLSWCEAQKVAQDWSNWGILWMPYVSIGSKRIDDDDDDDDLSN